MAPNPRVYKAFRAMKDLGISEVKVKPVLKHLLKIYDKNWELIEEENYRALADAIFEREEAEAVQPKKPENIEVPVGALDEEATLEEPERPLKRLRLKYQDSQPSPSQFNSAHTSLIKPKVEVEDLPNDHQQSSSHLGRMDMPQLSNRGMSVSSQPIQAINKRKQPTIDNPNKHLALQSAPQITSGALALIKPKDEPFTDDMPHYEAPIAILPPEPVTEVAAIAPNGNLLTVDQVAHQEALASGSNMGKDSRNDVALNQQLSRIEEERHASNLEIASSRYGEVKISINCSSAHGGPDFHLPSLEEVLKLIEDKCLRAYKIIDPGFSVTKLMKDMCECVLELGTKSYHERPETINVMSAAINQLEATLMEDDVFDSTCRLPDSTNELLNFETDTVLDPPQIPNLAPPSNGVRDNTLPDESLSEKNCAENGIEQTDLHIMVGVESLNASSNERISFPHEVIDITNGQEKMMISIVNEVDSECPPLFHYIPQNAVFQNARVNISLVLIGDSHCCLTCSGDCLSLSVPCACAQQKNGGFAYTKHGLVKEELLNESVSMSQDPGKHSQLFCKQCPVERSKSDDILEACKGHLARTFIKECWWKCGCNKQCGNRVVQRGIVRKLQVFMTSEGKGWGLRTLEDLPRGAFVCEYVGEVLTNAEFFDRISRSPSGEKHSHPVLLDAGWGSGDIKGDEALCLDATHYGNIARFINHRCFDSNLVNIPVEIESPDRHYYHFAFFTTRDVKAMEELTWDYGIDFDDLDHPVKAFQCQCGSQFCRNIKRLSRSRGRR
ncbi:hypothetical protein DM860_006506 [Cuscuta australis]|uniref:SET domain-containing protein n=1 Tax=Cuscuta australis TaxID=267555 RepID=A0A328D4H2_9ASTE|nr:hypothetical protein DM860_006506 [Cuscuta australis]